MCLETTCLDQPELPQPRLRCAPSSSLTSCPGTTSRDTHERKHHCLPGCKRRPVFWRVVCARSLQAIGVGAALCPALFLSSSLLVSPRLSSSLPILFFLFSLRFLSFPSALAGLHSPPLVPSASHAPCSDRVPSFALDPPGRLCAIVGAQSKQQARPGPPHLSVTGISLWTVRQPQQTA